MHIVRVHEQTCTCGLYQEYLIPCCHALAALYSCGVSLQDERFHLVPAWYKPLAILSAYDYIEIGMNEFGEDVTIHTGLRAIDITRLDDYAVQESGSSTLDEDPFADLVVDPPEVPRRSGRQRTKRREAGDGKGPLSKPQKPQTCSVCSEPGHNKLRCKRLQILEGDTPGLGVM
jgi:SWIM zinc finger